MKRSVERLADLVCREDLRGGAKAEAVRVLLYVLYVLVRVGLLLGLLITIALFRPTPIYTLAMAEHPDCLTPVPDREVMIGKPSHAVPVLAPDGTMTKAHS